MTKKLFELKPSYQFFNVKVYEKVNERGHDLGTLHKNW